ncbi:uncharacterized protein LOC133730365 [Rosa rugosa]|uniref:uncharacterized protein LOC133730365 n=1 Tax=Rosa rugosa TaxID=74645 RepID=UPI002B41475C|nr:uncharacterized protein LOC133730365 [Rosa rugosa]
MAKKAMTQMSNKDYVNKKTVLFSRQTSSNRVTQNTRFVDFRFKLSAWSGFLPMRLLKHFADKVAGTLCLGMASARAKPSRNDSSSRRSMPYVTPGDSHREEAIEDCIEFINSSSTFSRATPIASQVSS